jgi:hypothetical protein
MTMDGKNMLPAKAEARFSPFSTFFNDFKNSFSMILLPVASAESFIDSRIETPAE